MAFQTQLGRKIFLPVLNSQCRLGHFSWSLVRAFYSFACMHVLSPCKSCKLCKTGTGLAVKRLCTEEEEAGYIGMEVPWTLHRILGNLCTFFHAQVSLFKVTNNRAWHYQLQFFQDFMILIQHRKWKCILHLYSRSMLKSQWLNKNSSSS